MIEVKRTDILEENKTTAEDCKVDITLQGTTWDLILEYAFLVNKLETEMDVIFWMGVDTILKGLRSGEINSPTLSMDLSPFLQEE